MEHLILVINPGGGSTKIGLFRGEELIKEEVITHFPEEINKFDEIVEQLDFRKAAVIDFLKKNNIKLEELDAVVGRGGPFKPLRSGTYIVDQRMIDDVKNGNVLADHPSNLGCLLASDIAKLAGKKPAFIVDPVSVDEFIPESRISGLPEIERKSLAHTLNMKMVARKAATELSSKYNEINLVIVHLGTGISVGAYRKGEQIDVNNANDGGPFSPQRAGSLPITQLAKLCYSEKYPDYKSMYKRLTKNGGVLAYLGTDKMSEVEKMIEKGDKYAELIYNAMIQQIAKEIGSMAAVLSGNVQAIVITGGIAYLDKFVAKLKEKIKFITETIFVYPGEGELEALARGALRVLKGEEDAKRY